MTMRISELGFEIREIPDMTLKKYSSLDENGVEGVLRKHLTFLRDWNREGLISGLSLHLFYYYDGKITDGEYAVGKNGSKLKIYLLIRGEADNPDNISGLVRASALSPYFTFVPCSFEEFSENNNLKGLNFSSCSALSKKEVFIPSSNDSIEGNSVYYTVPSWEINEKSRLYNMFRFMDALDKSVLFRIDLYPVQYDEVLRNSLKKPVSVLRKRQLSFNGGRDFEGENVLRHYEELLHGIEVSPHFIADIFVFSDDKRSASGILSAAASEALIKGNYETSAFEGDFDFRSFLSKDEIYSDASGRFVMKRGTKGWTVCKKDAENFTLRYLPVLFTLEEAAAFFRFPVLYEGESISIRKETAPPDIEKSQGFYLGTDDNGYDVFLPLKHLNKHGFISGVPGSGKTNAMCHLTSTLWKKHNIPFLVLEPAKKEYRALLNQKGMEQLRLFSPNADMSFPLHINPFQFPEGMTLSEYIRTLELVFEGSFPMEAPAPFILDKAIEAIYKDKGWTASTVNTGKLSYPTLSELYEKFEEIVDTTDYDPEMRGNLRSVLQVRIGSLLCREMGDIFDVPFSSIKPEEWLEIPAVIELEALGTAQANFLTLLICAFIRETLKHNPLYEGEFARHVLFIEEAHNLIGTESDVMKEDSTPKDAATSFIVKMLAEVRSLKEGIVIADQLPTKMAPEVIKNTGFKLGLRITAADDRALLGSSVSAGNMQMEEMGVFETGRAIVGFEGLKRPFLVNTHEWCGKFPSDRCESSADCEKCEYFKSGDCIPDKSLRKAVTTPKSDRELTEYMKNNRFYKDSLSMSMKIESKKLYMQFCEANRKTDATLRLFEQLNGVCCEIDEKEKEILDHSKMLMSEEREEAIKPLEEMLEIKADELTCLSEQKIQLMQSDTFCSCCERITCNLSLAVGIHNKINRWKEWGVYGCCSETAEALENMIKSLMLDADKLFENCGDYLENPQEIKESINDIYSKISI